MNIVTSYTKNQLDRSSYISEDRYKRAFDLNRIRLITQRLAGYNNRYPYYYNLFMFQKMVERLNKLGVSASSQVYSVTPSSIADDAKQIEEAENTWGKELIDTIIDEVISDADSGDYDEPKTDEEIRKEAEDDASSDSDSGEYKMPPFDKNNPKDPIIEKIEEEGKEKAEEIADNSKSGGCDDTNKTEECTSDNCMIVCDYGPAACGNEDATGCQLDDCKVVCDTCGGDAKTACNFGGTGCNISTTPACISDWTYCNNCTVVNDDKCSMVCDTRIDAPPCDATTPCNAGDPKIWCDAETWMDCGDYPPGEGPCDDLPCGDTPVCGDCDDPVCGDCDTCAGGDCCVSDIPCADTPPCGDTCGAGDYEPPPCDTCGGDSGGCPADCCVSDCCIGDGGCASGDSCGNCDCCVSDSACTNVSCGGDMSCSSDCDCASDCGSNCDSGCSSDCDCGSDCDNYGDCIDSCGGNE